MPRPRSLDEDDLLASLAATFGEAGYAGASLAALSGATGLGRASLYHHFPRGKRQMAEEVLTRASGWMGREVLDVLKGPGEPRARVEAAADNLRAFYADGRKACLLNMLAAPPDGAGPFGPAIRAAFDALIDGFAGIAVEAGADPATARTRAARAVALWQGSLVLSRGLGSTRPFRDFLLSLPHDLLGPDNEAPP